jgi:hypothetical protein
MDLVVSIPKANLTRMSQINIGLYAAILRDAVELTEQVICLSGIAGSGRLDLLLVTRPNRDFPWLRQDSVASWNWPFGSLQRAGKESPSAPCLFSEISNSSRTTSGS